jgi:hypothetical protein
MVAETLNPSASFQREFEGCLFLKMIQWSSREHPNFARVGRPSS